MIIDPGQLDVDLSRLTEEKSMIATDTTMDNLSQHTIDDEFTRTLEDDIELEAECRGKIEFETAEDQLSILTHKLEHEMDELAKLEEEVVKVTSCGVFRLVFLLEKILTCCEKKLFYWTRKTFTNSRLKAKNLQKFESDRMIYSNCERSEQILKHYLFNLLILLKQIFGI